MEIFYTDLDNTMIYSYQHFIGADKRCVEVYRGREISFITEKTFELFNAIYQKINIVPVTTRTVEQYQRIDFGTGGFRYALTCNGGILLKDGCPDQNWYEESLKMTEDAREEMQKATELLQRDSNVMFEVRFIEKLFVFTKSNAPDKTAAMLQKHLDSTVADVFTNGVKVYVVPKNLDKGTAVKRFSRQFHIGQSIAAGDSLFDLSMLQAADEAICPEELAKYIVGKNPIVCKENELLSEKALERVLSRIAKTGGRHFG